MKITISKSELWIDDKLAVAEICPTNGFQGKLAYDVVEIYNKVCECWILRPRCEGNWLALIINDSDDGWIMVPPPRGRRNPDWEWQFEDGAAEKIRAWCEVNGLYNMNLEWEDYNGLENLDTKKQSIRCLFCGKMRAYEQKKFYPQRES